MPRKTNGIEIEIHPRPTKGEQTQRLFKVGILPMQALSLSPQKNFIKRQAITVRATARAKLL